MKIPLSFLQAYNESCLAYQRLQADVEPRLTEVAKKYNGSYSQRIKSPESLIIKAEKTGLENPFLLIDDLFACTITVANSGDIQNVITDVDPFFILVERRQRSLKPNQFDYNDVNLTLRVNPDRHRKDEIIVDLIFELQVKTLLQLAWSQASHDIIYKARKKTWGLTRVASQLRALLEMADSVLANLENAANLLQEGHDYQQYEELNSIVDMIERYWDERDQPQNLYRAAQVVDIYIKRARVNLDYMETLIRKNDYLPYITAKSITPTQTIFILLFLDQGGNFINRFDKKKILLTDEMFDLCPELARIRKDRRARMEPIKTK